MVVVVAVVLVLLCGSVPSIAQTNFSGSAFDCPALERSDGTPTSVHGLRPSDIAVIAAMGNSLTAGFGILSDIASIYANYTDYRGLAWSAGGDASLPYVTTLPNILRQFNPDLYSFSTGITLSDDYLDQPNTQLNLARSGAHASEMLQQAQDLVAKIRQSDQVDFDNDWKLVTLLIGTNDLCQLTCVNDTDADPEVWIQNVKGGLDYLRDNLPRTFVNLQLLPTENATQVLATDGQICRDYIRFLCPCSLLGSDLAGDFYEIEQQYRRNLQNLVDSGRYDGSDDFTVVLLTTLQFNTERDISSFAVDWSTLVP